MRFDEGSFERRAPRDMLESPTNTNSQRVFLTGSLLWALPPVLEVLCNRVMMGSWDSEFRAHTNPGALNSPTLVLFMYHRKL